MIEEDTQCQTMVSKWIPHLHRTKVTNLQKTKSEQVLLGSYKRFLGPQLMGMNWVVQGKAGVLHK